MELSRTLARLYYVVRRGLSRAEVALWSIFTGFWLGVLGRSSLNEIDDIYYRGGQSKKFSPIDYRSDRYNRTGLWAWETNVINRYFGESSAIAVLGAGGGREVLALRKLGFSADGWECQGDFAEVANRLLVEDGFEPSVSVAPRDTCPSGERGYTAAIVGWGTYTLIQGRRRRIAMLRALRDRVVEGSPVLVSFYARKEAERRYQLVAAIANAARVPLGRERAEVGDHLEPNFVHYFTEEELRAELEEAGFVMALYQRHPYGHAVAHATSPRAG